MNEAPTPRSTSESEPAMIHDYKADIEVTLEQAQTLEPEQRLQLMESFLNDVYDDAEQGLVKSRAGETSGPDDMTMRLSTLMSQLSEGDEESNALLLIPSAGGLRASIEAYLSDSATAGALTKAIEGRTYENTLESLPHTDAKIHEVGNQTLHAAGVETSAYDQLFDPSYEPVGTEGAAVRTAETDDQRLNRERSEADARDAALKYAAQQRAGIR